MKAALFFLILLMSQLAMSQTMKEKRVKQEMLERVDLLIEKAESVKDLLEVNRKETPSDENVGAACRILKDLFEIYPEHVKAIGGHLDLFAARTVWLKNEALAQLITIHRQTLVCKQGKNQEYVDPSALHKEFENIVKSLEKQKKRISKSDASYENSFYYEYEF